MGDLIKNNKLLRIQQAKVSNTRERNIAKQYFNSRPSIGNLARAAYHWYNSVPGLGGEDESGNIIIGGEAPTPGMRNPKDIVKGVKPVIKIVKKNAAKITPAQWTAAQDAAIARGDMAEAQRLRDLHFKVKAPDTKIIDETGNPLTMYHGTTPEGDYILRHNGVTYKPNGLNMFFTSNYYGQYLGGTRTKSVPLYINATKIGLPGNHYEIGSVNPLKYLRKGQDGLYEWGFLKNNDFASNEAFEKMQNYIISKEIPWAKSKELDLDLDNLGKLDIPKFFKALEEDINTQGIGHHPVEELAVPKGEQVKLADAVTYDNNGVRIPLGQRDNFNINDIRYGLLPIIGGIGLGTYSVNKKKQGGQIVKNFKRKFLFGGKYTYDWKNSPIKTSYGYPVYWSNNVPEEYKWAADFLKNNPNTTGMAVGGGALGDWDTGPRVIIRNLNSNMITDPNDSRWKALDKIEAVRHYMVETNFNPYFKISPEQEYFRKTRMPKDDPYNTNDDAWRESIISRIIAGDMDGTPEQMKIVDKFEKDFYKLKGNGKYW